MGNNVRLSIVAENTRVQQQLKDLSALIPFIYVGIIGGREWCPFHSLNSLLHQNCSNMDLCGVHLYLKWIAIVQAMWSKFRCRAYALLYKAPSPVPSTSVQEKNSSPPPSIWYIRPEKFPDIPKSQFWYGIKIQ